MARHDFMMGLLTRAGKRLGLLLALLTLLSFLIYSVFINRPLGEWISPSVPDLAATGDLPRLSEAISQDEILATKVKTLAAMDENTIFGKYRETDVEIVTILLMWAQADMTNSAKTPEGLDSRIDTFLRKIYGFGPEEYILGDPLMGEDPWVRWFNHYKPRLLIQTSAQRVYDGRVFYDPIEDRMFITGDISRRFMNHFKDFLAQQPDPAPYINNLLAFVDSTKGLRNLSEKDKETVQELMALRAKP